MTPPLHCAECGTRAEPGQPFCDACGAVLSWTNRADGDEQSAAETHTCADGVEGGPGSSTDSDSDSGGASAPTDAAVDDTPPAETITPASTPFPMTPSPGTNSEETSDRARQLLVPIADAEPRPMDSPPVAPVLPGLPAPQRPQAARAPGEELGVNDGAPCPWCTTRNRPDRHFCTRCAMPLAGEAQGPVWLPWWRRLVGPGNREAPWAGERPRLRRAFDRVLSLLGAAIVVTLLIVLSLNIPKGVQAAIDHFSKRAAVEPDTWSASQTYPGHKAGLTGDKLNDTWWGPGVSESGQGQWIQAEFDEPTRLLDLIITPGVSTRADEISQSARVRRLKAEVTLSDGKNITKRINLDPGAGGQRIPFRVGTVSAVRFTIESATGTSSKKQVAIAEIEFFGRSNANSA